MSDLLNIGQHALYARLADLSPRKTKMAEVHMLQVTTSSHMWQRSLQA